MSTALSATPGAPILKRLVSTPDMSVNSAENDVAVLAGNGDVGTPEQINEPTFPANAEPERAKWGSKLQYILANIGLAVGLGNVWRFPYLCYKNGGGAFLVPYILSLAFMGIPMFLLEMSAGQRFALGARGVWQKVSPLLGGVGLASLVVSLVVSTYYNVIIMWSILYLFHSFNPDLPWDGYQCVERDGYLPCHVGNDSSTKNFWYQEIVHASGSIDDTGPVEWQPTLCLLFAWAIVYLCICNGIQSSGKVVYFTATFPYLILGILFIKSVTLPGAADGLKFYLQPDFARLSDPLVWMSAAGQIFYSLGLGFGGVIAFSSFNPKKNDCYKDCFIVALTNCCTSVFAGFAVFSVLGHMAHLQNTTISEVVDGGPGLAFIVYPQVLSQMPGANFWSICFFFMLFLLGLGSQFGTMEGCVTVMVDMKLFPSTPRWVISGCICLSMFVVSLLFMCHAGLYYFELFDIYAGTLPLFCIGLCELTAVAWVYGVDNYIDDVNEMTGRKLGRYWWYCWKWVSPCLITCILVAVIARAFVEPTTYEPGLVDDKGDPVHAPFSGGHVFLGWCLALASILCIPANAYYSKRNGSWRRFKNWVKGFTFAKFVAELKPSTSRKIPRMYPLPVSGEYVDKTGATGGVVSNGMSPVDAAAMGAAVGLPDFEEDASVA